MKTKYLLLITCLFFIATAVAQPKPKAKLKKPSNNGVIAAKQLRTNYIEMHKADKIIGAKQFKCDALPYLKAIPKKKMVPRLYTMARALDTLKKKVKEMEHSIVNEYADIIDAFVHTTTYDEFAKVLLRDGYPIKIDVDKMKKRYNNLLILRKGNYILHEEKFKTKTCEYKIVTGISYDSNQFSAGKKNPKVRKFRLDITWDLSTIITMKCSCKKKGAKDVQSAVFEYSGKAISHKSIIYDASSGFMDFLNAPIDPAYKHKPEYFLRLKNVVCCPAKTPKTEDGSFINPDENEDILFPNQFIEVGAGVGTAKDEETELCASVGFMHNLFSEEENSALFIGGRASVHNASFSTSNFSQTTINVGPTVEHQTFIGDTSTKWINGLNGAFVFGSQDASGFKTDISGINVGLYTGVEVPLGDQFSLGVMATLLELNNLTFKTDELESKSNSTSINLNKGSVGLSLRITLDKN